MSDPVRRQVEEPQADDLAKLSTRRRGKPQSVMVCKGHFRVQINSSYFLIKGFSQCLNLSFGYGWPSACTLCL